MSRNNFQVVDEDTGEITGILDWDRAASAPAEAAWLMLAWLWDQNACGSNELGWEVPCCSCCFVGSSVEVVEPKKEF